MNFFQNKDANWVGVWKMNEPLEKKPQFSAECTHEAHCLKYNASSRRLTSSTKGTRIGLKATVTLMQHRPIKGGVSGTRD